MRFRLEETDENRKIKRNFLRNQNTIQLVKGATVHHLNRSYKDEEDSEVIIINADQTTAEAIHRLLHWVKVYNIKDLNDLFNTQIYYFNFSDENNPVYDTISLDEVVNGYANGKFDLDRAKNLNKNVRIRAEKDNTIGDDIS